MKDTTPFLGSETFSYTTMVKGGAGGQNLPADVAQVIDQLERHCLAPDGSLVPKPTRLLRPQTRTLSLSFSLVWLLRKLYSNYAHKPAFHLESSGFDFIV